MAHNYERGIQAENFFSAMLNKFGVKYSYENIWFDFLVNDKHKVEVKSCSLLYGNKTTNRLGRFQFSLDGGRKQIFFDNLWVCFIVEYKGQFILMGLCRTEKLKEKRFVSLCELEKINLLSFDEWIKEIL